MCKPFGITLAWEAVGWACLRASDQCRNQERSRLPRISTFQISRYGSRTSICGSSSPPAPSKGTHTARQPRGSADPPAASPACRPRVPEPEPGHPGQHHEEMRQSLLLELYCSAGFFKLFLEVLGIGLGGAFLDYGRCALDGVLCFLEAQTGDGADRLDDGNLVGAEAGHYHVELGLFFLCGSGFTGAGAGSGDRNRGGGRNAPLLLEHLDELDD